MIHGFNDPMKPSSISPHLPGLADDSRISRTIELALLEDCGLGDVTSDATVPEKLEGTAVVVVRESGIIAGLDVAGLVFQACDPTIHFAYVIGDGSATDPETTVATVTGRIRSILRAERTALNILQRMSGIATATRAYVTRISGTPARITDTRKTAPGLRVFDKWAVRLGGGVNHRFGLDDMVLIKDNHIAAAGGVAKALRACSGFIREHGLNIRVEVEVTNLDELKDALESGGFDRVMLDNFDVESAGKAVALIDHGVEVEASGGIILENVRSYALAGVDFISIGALTHSVRSLDISLELNRLQR
jgi:nicotinate-nucleotide pyrophosphorylase (carboxylating)